MDRRVAERERVERTARRAVVDAALLRDVKAGESVELPDDVAHYFTRVLRLRDGAHVTLLDGDGRVVDGALQTRGATVVENVTIETARDPLPPLVVYQALVRGTKLDEVVQRATELGASAVVVFQAARTVVGDGQVKLARLEKIAQDATRQSLRARAPRIAGTLSFDDLIVELRAFPGAIIFGAPSGSTRAQHALTTHEGFRTHGMAVIIGPEGGLDDAEERALAALGAQPVTLGVHVLRTETAAMVALAAAQGALGHL
jgi:16S rRNA (uracil1498-N3)-methyltransferase